MLKRVEAGVEHIEAVEEAAQMVFLSPWKVSDPAALTGRQWGARLISCPVSVIPAQPPAPVFPKQVSLDWGAVGRCLVGQGPEVNCPSGQA